LKAKKFPFLQRFWRRTTMKRTGLLVASLLAGASVVACGGGGGGGMVAAPGLELSATTETFVGTTGAAANPAPAMVNVVNTGGGALNFTAASDSPWLMVSPASGTAPQTLTISAVVGALAPSNNTGHITVTATGAQNSPGMVTVTFIVAPVASNAPVWPQWGANPQHSGMLGGTAGQSVATKHADIVYDPFIDQEKAENTPLFGEAVLTVHEQAPITDGNDVYMVMKTGSYMPCNPAGKWATGGACGPNTWNTMIWNEARCSWINGTLTQIWEWASDWVPEPNAANFQQGFAGLEGWEPVFHPADANGFIYAPGAQGAIWKLNKADGSVAKHIMPSFSGANVTPANTFVSSPLTADAQGNIYYNVIAVNTAGGNPWGQNDVAGAWLVKVTPGDAATMATYASLVPGAPAGNSLNCPGTFFFSNPVPPFPWPPSSNAIAPNFPFPCGSQRPGVNVAPAVSADGSTVYTASVAHFDNMVAYVVAVNAGNLTPKWQASLQNRLNDGCGMVLPIAGAGVTTLANSCLFGTNVGVDPTTNAAGSGTIADVASSSPTVLPDGSVVFGATDNYNFGRGHLFRFDATGNFVAAYDFGWDSTPAVYTHGGTFSVIIKDNHYDASAYCSGTSLVCTPRQKGPYYITQIDANFNIEWQFQNTTIDGTHPDGYEWCINMPAVDMNGNVFVNSEDGNIYELPQGHSGIFTTPVGQTFLNLALGAAYTPLSIGADGKLYTQNNGHLFVVGN
jgi:BACON domain-containing protein